jgi:predicted TIM-barrel fold metal-dependent hydrolase
VPSFDYPIIDLDGHYYEPDDCCTRHLEAKYRDRAVHVAVNERGEREWRAGKRALGFDRRPLDFVLEPGELRRMHALPAGDPAAQIRVRDSLDPAFRDRDARITKLDEFGVQASLMFSSLSFETELMDDPEAACANVRAYNRWVEEEWGYAYRGRLFAPALITLADRDGAVDELERVLRAGARLAMLRTGPVLGRSPADPHFDPFWARLDEARLPLILHVSLSTYETEFSRFWGENPQATMFEFSAFQWLTTFMHRPIVDTVASLIYGNLFGRFPNLHAISIENGSRWVRELLSDMDHVLRYTGPATRWLGGKLRDRPSDVFRQHVSIAPFYEPHYETSVAELMDLLGAERVVFGSDWPHGEGKPTPADYLEDMRGLDALQKRKFLRDNGAALLGLAS